MAEYTPSEDEMRHAYWLTRMLDHHADVDAAFDRFLARVRRDAWDEGSGGRDDLRPNPYREQEPTDDGPAGEHPGTDLPALAEAIKAQGR